MSRKVLLGVCVGALVAFSEPGFASESPQEGGETASSPPPGVASDCNAPETQAARSECAARELEAATTAHERVFEACTELVGPRLRPQLIDTEASWKRNRRTECAVEAAAFPDESARDFVHSRCLARSTRRRTRALFSAHPDCADPR